MSRHLIWRLKSDTSPGRATRPSPLSTAAIRSVDRIQTAMPADKSKYAIAIYDYRGATDEECDFDKGDIFEIVNHDNAEWWYVRFEDDKDVEGYVPSTYVKVVSPDEVQRLGNERDDEEEYEEDDQDADYDDDDESYNDDGGSRSDQNVYRNLPVSALAADLKAHVAQHKLFGGIPVTPSTPTVHQLTAPPVKVEGFPDLTRGFRPSTLAFAAKHGIGQLRNSLLPKLDESGLGFADLMLDLKKNRIRRRITKLNVAFSILEAKHVLPPPAGLRVLGRHVRVAIFDRVGVVANMLSVDAVVNQDLWKFSTKTSLLFPKDDENTCLLRANAVDFRLCVLFELCVVVAKPNSKPNSNGNDVEDISCGWGVFPLYSADGGPVENKPYDIKLYGGTPLDKEAEAFEIGERKGFLSNFINPSRAPKLSIRIWKLSNSAMVRINQLPDTILTFLSWVPVLAMYRSVLATSLLVPHESRGLNLAPSYDPILALVPVLMEQNDLARLLEVAWEKKFRVLKRREKKSSHMLSQTLLDACLAVYPLLHIIGMPKHIPGDAEKAQVRRAFMDSFSSVGLMEMLGKNPHLLTYEAFDAKEVTFDYLSSAKASALVA
ncbi:hypothetical protein SeLEV6574_g05536 [Synchytrium endobioticum]|uniref:SH3 domain-containing protein n=1 Tax=Synchytrium endobioticum TaxID=286115 RepID=A0A507CTQ5_9FUNG|nr:hypothetical protein SeLEV6574_g05541 [Synchytrium endobioticum]TPX42554.1 hypothetical protein SeLEV6574_g05536 [Synchytrium endobioticum]